jgi:transcriptional regulator with XRE-family HTH domain
MTSEGAPGRVEQTDLPFAEAATALVRARQIGVRQLARDISASPSHVSRVLRGAQDKQPSVELIGRVARALGVPPSYFVEVRRGQVVSAIVRDVELVNSLHQSVRT